MQHLIHFLAIVRYEFKMHWRGRAMKVIFLALLLQILAGILISAASAEIETQRGTVTIEQAFGSFGDVITFIVWAPTSVLLALLLPLVVADTIPRDRQLGVNELLETTPLADGVYLIAKAAGVWVTVMAGAGVALVVGGVVAYWQFGPYDPAAYIHMAVIGVGSMVVINNGLAVLITATQPNRRRAILMVFGLVTVLFFAVAMQSGPVAYAFSPLREPIFEYFLMLGVTEAALYSSIAIGLAQVALVWAVMWAWRRWKR